MSRRRSLLPRSTLPLLLLVLVAAGWLHWGGWRRPAVVTADLLTTMPDSVVSLRWLAPGDRVLLRRRGSRWELSGNVRDAVDPRRMNELLHELATLQAEILPDAVGDSTRFGLGPRSPRLLLTMLDGRRRLLRFGLQNQATGRVYGLQAGPGRILALPSKLIELLGALPDRVRARELWPGFTRQGIDTVTIRHRGRSPAVLVRRAGRWWWRADTVPAAELPGWWTDLLDRLPARRRQDASGRWWLCDEARVRELLVELGATRIKDLSPAAVAAGTLLTIRVADRYGDQRHRVDFCPPEAATLVDAWRDGGNVAVRTIGSALRLARRPAREVLATSVLTWPVRDADSLRVVWVGIDSFTAVREDREWTVPGATSSTHPTPGETARDLTLHLDRLRIAALAPRGNAPRDWSLLFRITIWRRRPGAPPREVLLVGSPVGGASAWLPASRFLCRIDHGLLTTLRAVCSMPWVRR